AVEDKSGTSAAGVAGTFAPGASAFGRISVTVAGGGESLGSEGVGLRMPATGAGGVGLVSKMVGDAPTAGGSALGTTGRGVIAVTRATGEPTPGGAGTEGGDADPMRSPGNRMPQKPTMDSVNSSST